MNCTLFCNFLLKCTTILMITEFMKSFYFRVLFEFQVMDCVVAFYFYHLGAEHGIYHYWYFGLTLTFVLLPSLTMTGFSLRWYLMDAENSQLPDVPVWRWIVRVLVLLFQVSK